MQKLRKNMHKSIGILFFYGILKLLYYRYLVNLDHCVQLKIQIERAR